MYLLVRECTSIYNHKSSRITFFDLTKVHHQLQYRCTIHHATLMDYRHLDILDSVPETLALVGPGKKRLVMLEEAFERLGRNATQATVSCTKATSR
jgi:hypothetical protein